VDYFSPGARELARKLGRGFNRLRILAQRRLLARAETELGLLGWQQADYDEETQREVDKIQNYEREQARLTNESAEMSRVIRALREEADQARKEYEDARRQIDGRIRESRDPIAAEEKQLATLVREEPNFQKRMPELDREQREVSNLYSELLASPTQTPQIRIELARLRERSVAIPNEKADLRTQHMRLVTEIKSLERSLAERREQTADLEQELKALTSSFQTADRERSSQIKSRERDKARLEKEVDALELGKANPYQQIGRVLANSNLAPMNQPQALEKVRQQRFVLDQLDYQIALSLQQSSAADPALVRISYMLWGVMAVAVGLLVAVLVTG
jgi:chromosome segregation ATPase